MMKLLYGRSHKNNKGKFYLALSMVLLMVFSIVPITVFANDDVVTTSDGAGWREETGGLTETPQAGDTAGETSGSRLDGADGEVSGSAQGETQDETTGELTTETQTDETDPSLTGEDLSGETTTEETAEAVTEESGQTVTAETATEETGEAVTEETVETATEANTEVTHDNLGGVLSDGVMGDESGELPMFVMADSFGPSLSLVWDLAASKFNYSNIDVSDDKTDIDITLNQNSTQTATLQMTFAMNGVEEAAPGEIEIRVPMYIFSTRDGANTGGYKLNLQKDVPQGDTGFYYVVEGDELVIRNFNTIGGGETFLVQIDFTFLPANLKDGFSNKEIAASFTIHGGTPQSSNALGFTAHTSVSEPKPLSKTATKHEIWQAAWGKYEEIGGDGDPKDFYYLVWEVQLPSDSGSTQPYTVVLTDTQSDGTFLGAAGSGSGKFSTDYDTKIERQMTSSTAYATSRYYLIKYPRSMATEQAKVTNHAMAALTGKDNTTGSPNYIVEVTGEYKYTMLEFHYTGDGFSITKLGPSTNDKAAVGAAEKLLQAKPGELLSVELTAKPGTPYSFEVTADARGYKLTQKESGDPEDPDYDKNPGNYGYHPYSTSILDDMLFLKDERLLPGDYSITSVYLTYNEYDYVENENTMAYVEKLSDDYAAYSPVELLYRTDGGAWISGGLVQRTGSSTYTYSGTGTPTSVSSTAQIQLPEGVSEIQLVHVGSRYRVYMKAYFTVVLYSTENVLSLLESQTSMNLHNVATLLVRDYKGAIQTTTTTDPISGTPALKDAVIKHDKDLYGSVLQHATSYIRLDPYRSSTSITKSQSNYTDNGSEQTLTYTVSMYESGSYNPAHISAAEYKALEIVKEQREGTFYDLLPKGTAADNISVRLYNGSTDGAEAEVTWRTVADWQGSGRTMLIIHAKAPADTPNYNETTSSNINTLRSGFRLTYRLINSYFNILDNGISTTNIVAYRSGVGRLGSGGPASSSTYQYFRALESDERDDDNQDTVYDYLSYTFTKPTAALFGIFKQVKAAGGFGFSGETEVFPTGGYSYQLRYSNSSTSGKGTDLVIYDVLEDHGDWRGALDSVDLAFVRSLGINPVLYYATAGGLEPHSRIEHADLTNTAIWHTTRPTGAVTAIAVDLRHKNDGSLYEIGANETIFFEVNMVAPAYHEGLMGKTAVNKTSYRMNYILGGSITATSGLSKETKVFLRHPMLTIEKEADPESSASATNPAVVGRGETLTYTVTVANLEGETIADIEVVDVIPATLTIHQGEIKYYFGADSGSASAITGAGRVSLRSEGQKLTFHVDELAAGETVSFLITTTVKAYTEDGDRITNKAHITKINDKTYVVESNKTWHQVDPVLSLRANKVLEGRKLAEGEFSFEVRNTTDGALAATGTNKADGTVTFSEINYKQAGEYRYTITEVSGSLEHMTYDTTAHQVTVVVDFDDSGRLIATAVYQEGGVVFTNIYEAPPPPEPEKPEEPKPEEPEKPEEPKPEEPEKPTKPGTTDPETTDPPGTTVPPGTTDPPKTTDPGTTNPPTTTEPPVTTEPPRVTEPPQTTEPNEPPARPPMPTIPLDDNGVPTGEWHWDGDQWIFEEFPPLGNLPKTGDTGIAASIVWILSVSFLATGAIMQRLSRRHGAHERRHGRA